MEKEKRALSWREFVESGFDGREYTFSIELFEEHRSEFL